MPADAPPAKVEATRGYGAEIVTYDRYSENRAQLGEALAAERGLTLIPPYDDDLIIAGQGTAALELIEDHAPLDLLVVPVGGGGLIAGSAIVATSMIPGMRVTGVEPAAGDDTRRSLEQGRPVRIPVPQTIADGQQVEMPGRITFPINQKLVDEIAVVTDGEIIGAMAFAVDYLKTVVEPSGASGLAAVLARNITLEGARVGVILSGGNVGARRLAELLGRVS
jgi:threonine dehydratase